MWRKKNHLGRDLVSEYRSKTLENKRKNQNLDPIILCFFLFSHERKGREESNKGSLSDDENFPLLRLYHRRVHVFRTKRGGIGVEGAASCATTKRHCVFPQPKGVRENHDFADVMFIIIFI